MKAIIAVSLLLSGLILAGCAGTQAQQSNEVKFGWIGPLSGDVASLGVPVKDAAVLAVDEINQKNLLNGKKLTLIFEDESCDPKKSVTAVRKLIGVDGVVAIAGSLCSGSTLADAPIVEQNKVLLLSYGSTNPKIKDAGDYVFRNVPSDAGQGAAGADTIKSFPVKNVALLYINNDWGVGLKDVFTPRAKEIGLNLVATESFDSNAADMRTQIQKIKSANAEAIYLLAYPQETGIALKQLKEAGLSVPIVGADASKDDAVISGAAGAAEGFLVTAPGVPDSPELEAFNKAYKSRYGKDWQPYTPEAYDAIMILAKACAATDCTSTAMKDYLYKMGPYKGASGTFEFDSNGEVQKPYDYFQVNGGKWVKAQVIDNGGLVAE